MVSTEKNQDRNKGRIFSINYSRKKGTTKTTVEKSNLIENFGLEDDAHAGPGARQVSLLAIESIKKQADCPRVKAENLSLGPGDFAENITTEGLNLTQLNIGDKLKIKKQVVLEISKIGKECHKYCAIYQRVGDCIMPREGIFAKVTRGGEVAIADEIEVVKNAKRTIVGRSLERAEGFKFVVLTISDRCSRGEAKDESGKVIVDLVKNINGENIRYDIVPDEADLIKEKLVYYCDELKVDLVLTTGGTGLGPRDVTPEATKQIMQKIIPGISELIRLEGLKKTKKAVLSRGISVIRGTSIIINLPGSPKGVKESLQAILDIVHHMLDMARGRGHNERKL